MKHRRKVDPPDTTHFVQIRVRLDEHTRIRHALKLAGVKSVSEWLRPHVLALADEVIAKAGRTIEFGTVAEPRGGNGRPRKAS